MAQVRRTTTSLSSTAEESDLHAATGHLEQSIATNGEHHKAKVLLAIIRRQNGEENAQAVLDHVLRIDPLDHWARYEKMLGGGMNEGEFLGTCRNDAQTILDIVFDYADAGYNDAAAGLLELHLSSPVGVRSRSKSALPRGDEPIRVGVVGAGSRTARGSASAIARLLFPQPAARADRARMGAATAGERSGGSLRTRKLFL